MGEESEAIWPGWHDVAKVLNLFINWVVILLCLIPFIQGVRLGALANSILPGSGTPLIVRSVLRFACGAASGVLYFVFCFKAIKDKDLTSMMHIMLLVCVGLAYVGLWYAGLAITAQFIIVGILSDTPLWKAFSK